MPADLPDDVATELRELAARAFEAVGYRPIVSVTVPGKYRPSGPAAAIADLAQPVKDHLELVQDCK